MTISLSKPAGVLSLLAFVELSRWASWPVRPSPAPRRRTAWALDGHADPFAGTDLDAPSRTPDMGASVQGPASATATTATPSAEEPRFKGWTKAARIAQSRQMIKPERPNWNAPHHWLL